MSEVEMIAANPCRESNEWSPLLHEELKRLPEKYRAPMVLCYLQGKTNQEAAELLAWPVGTVKGRLTCAREILRKRLTRRGVMLSSGLLATALTQSASSAAVPAVLLDSTVRAGMLVAAGPVATAGVSVSVAALTKGVVQTMFITKLTTICGMVVGVSLLGGTAAVVAHRVLAGAPQFEQVAVRSEPSLQRLELPQPDQQKTDVQKQDATEQAEEAARRQSMNNLKQLALAMHNYLSEYGQFPPAAVYSKDGKALVSWRVLLLPYLDQRDLYLQFKLDEPWDGPTNKKLLDKMPEIFSFAPERQRRLMTPFIRFLRGPAPFSPVPRLVKSAISPMAHRTRF